MGKDKPRRTKTPRALSSSSTSRTAPGWLLSFAVSPLSFSSPPRPHPPHPLRPTVPRSGRDGGTTRSIHAPQNVCFVALRWRRDLLIDACPLLCRTPVLPSPPASHTLPPEVVELIILAAIPPNSHELHAFPTRSSILLSLSLVSPTFRAIAQRELLRDVTLETTERATAFASQGDRRWDQVRVLRVGREVTNQSSWAFGLEAAGFVLSRLLSQCTRLEQLWLRQLRHVNLSGLHGKPGCELWLFIPAFRNPFADWVAR